MKVNLICDCSEEVLEKYVMGMLSSQDSGPVEEHLLACVTCQCRVEVVEEYVRVVRAAAAILNAGPPGPARVRGVSKPGYEWELQLCS
jgi:anti-sigma factor RsiW